MTTRTKIVIIEDEPDLALGLRDNLEFEGYAVVTASDGETGIECVQANPVACILLDIMLPGIDGFEVCSRLRKLGCRAPIIMLTARDQEVDKVRGLELGADDYLTKPFGIQELLARIRAVLRRAGSEDQDALAREIMIGSTSVCFQTGRVECEGKESILGYYEAEILRMLLARRGEVVDRRDLLKEIWGVENEPMNRSADNHVVSLRRKIERRPTSPQHILTVHGFGYKLV